MATQERRSMCWHSGEKRIAVYPEAASQSFKKGEMVYLASGKVTVCASNAVTILGMALQDASGTTDTEISVLVATDGTRFEGNVYHSTAASAITAITQTDKYAYLLSSNIGYVDIEDTSYDAFVIEKIIGGEGKAVGDSYGRVVFKVINAAQQKDAIAS